MPAQVLAIQPLELDQVEDRSAQRDALEVKALQHFFERKDIGKLGVDTLAHDLLLGGMRHAAAHQTEKVNHRFGQKTCLAVID